MLEKMTDKRKRTKTSPLLGPLLCLCASGWAISCYGRADLERSLNRQEAVIAELKARLIDQMAKRESCQKQEDHLAREHSEDRKLLGDLREALQGLEWQMGVVIETCPGRARPPSLPRP